ncbi:hypothetical protein SAMN05216436_11598 [bacterium A37T11]|nr:hypothetical protein SAMN05216436_11598 [bacterium A37T11]
MKDFDEIKQLWHVQETSAGPLFKDVTKAVRETGKGYAQKLLVQTLSVAVVLIALLAIWIWVPFLTWTAHLSLLIISVCVGYYLTVQWRDYQRIKDSSALLGEPEKYLEYVKSYQASRYKLNTRNYLIYLCCISLAIGIYGIEMYFMMSTVVFCAYMAFTIAWIAACYFIFMKAYMKRENQRLQDIISQLEHIRKQFQ